MIEILWRRTLEGGCARKCYKTTHLFSEFTGFRQTAASVILCLCHFDSHRRRLVLILHIGRFNASSLLGKLLNISLRASISISVSLTVCLHSQSLLLFIHAQTPLSFSSSCPSLSTRYSSHISPFLSLSLSAAAWRIVASSSFCWALQRIKI